MLKTNGSGQNHFSSVPTSEARLPFIHQWSLLITHSLHAVSHSLSAVSKPDGLLRITFSQRGLCPSLEPCTPVSPWQLPSSTSPCRLLPVAILHVRTPTMDSTNPNLNSTHSLSNSYNFLTLTLTSLTEQRFGMFVARVTKVGFSYLTSLT